jgi:hypothetical protein
MKQSLLSRQWLLVVAFAALGAVTTLPLALDSLRSDVRASTPSAGKVTLTCFDRDMRPHDCVVNPAAKLASK